LAEAIEIVALKGDIHGVYNVGSPHEFTNVEVATMICNAFGVTVDESVGFVKDRPFNDRRYAVVWDRITQLGWTPKRHLTDQLPTVVQWYRDNASRYVRDVGADKLI
jgi:dTDP-D-glucose 4,6-dehydratase